MRELHAFVEGVIWTAERPLRFFGLPMGTRMTVVRLRSGDLWIHSPVTMSREEYADLDVLGPVRFIVAPSKLHHLFVSEFREHYPSAELWVSPDLPRKRPEIDATRVLDSEASPGWAQEIEHRILRGHRYLDEVAFYHRDTRTLILADLLESAHADSPWLMRVAGRLAGIYERPAPPPDMRATFRRQAESRQWVRAILDWDFDRVVLAHGHTIPSGGKAVFEQAYAFLTA